HERLRGLGLGLKIKAEQIERVAGIKNSDGSHRYDFISSRNRVDEAYIMSRINESFYAYLVKTYQGQYGSPDAQAYYFRLPLRRMGHDVNVRKKSAVIDCSNSIQ